jgi:hypothetical protein
MFSIKNTITLKQAKLKKVIEIKKKILNGATGFEILYETEKDYQLTYLFDKIEKSMLKDLGEDVIIDDDMKVFANEILKALNNEIQIIEQDLKYLQFKLDKISHNKTQKAKSK